VTRRDPRAAVRELLAGGEPLALGLDFDGTLAPIVADPDDAALPAGTRRHLTALADVPAVDVAVISGRKLADVRSRVGVAGIGYAGNHGFELRRGETAWIHPAAERHRPALEQARERLERELAPVPGCFVEDKQASLTVHHRQAGPEAGSVAVAAVRAVADDEDRLSVVVDDQSVELRPDVDYDKGDAVEELLVAGPRTSAVYVGDARTDVDAFRALAARDGTTVRVAVGGDLPASNYRLESPADVERFLGWLRAEVGASGE